MTMVSERFFLAMTLLKLAVSQLYIKFKTGIRSIDGSVQSSNLKQKLNSGILSHIRGDKHLQRSRQWPCRDKIDWPIYASPASSWNTVRWIHVAAVFTLQLQLKPSTIVFVHKLQRGDYRVFFVIRFIAESMAGNLSEE
jgi:hypothetical protein